MKSQVPHNPTGQPTSRRHRDARGIALIETLVAIVVLGLAGTAVLAAVLTAVRSDGQQRSLSQASVTSRNYDDALTDAPYSDCATPAAYSPTTIGFDEGIATTLTVDSVTFWNDQPLPTNADPTPAQWATAFATACTTDPKLQRVTYTVTSRLGGTNTTMTRSVLKRFNGSLPEPEPDPPPGGRKCEISDRTRVKSTWVNQDLIRRDTNYSSGSGSGELNILYLDGTRRFSYLKFDIAPNVTCDNGGTLPTGATILAAEVRLYTYNIGGFPACGANSCWHVMEKVRGTWDESTLTWNHQPCPATPLGASCKADNTASTTLFEHGTGAFNWSARYQRVRSAELLAEVQGFYANPSTNYGWVIKEACAVTYSKACGSATPGFQMRSSRFPGASQRPTLVVYY